MPSEIWWWAHEGSARPPLQDVNMRVPLSAVKGHNLHCKLIYCAHILAMLYCNGMKERTSSHSGVAKSSEGNSSGLALKMVLKSGTLGSKSCFACLQPPALPPAAARSAIHSPSLTWQLMMEVRCLNSQMHAQA